MDQLTQTHPTHTHTDIALAGGLAAAPAWAPWLSEVNAWLTTASLTIGLVIGLIRLVQFSRPRPRD